MRAGRAGSRCWRSAEGGNACGGEEGWFEMLEEC